MIDMPVAGTPAKETKTFEGIQLQCFHCGEECPDRSIHLDEKFFCCEGCKMVYEILQNNDLCRYYEIDKNAGISLKGKRKEEFSYLDDLEVRDRLIDFTNGEQTKITFFLPQIHCASCIWLLENLYKLNDGVLSSRVNFLKKEIYIAYSEKDTTLRKLVELLADIGYAPAINLSALDSDNKPLVDRSFYYQIGVAGFAFGNIMLLSFPEYLGLDKHAESDFFQVFGYLNILLSLPVVFYSGRSYLQSAWLGLKNRSMNIDVPISLGILTLFGRSVFEILTHTGAGYLDSLAGLIFFLLAGKWFQQRTYHNISFERDYKSYFPIAAHKKTGETEMTVALDKLQPGDTIIIRHRELVPADSILLRGEARIDYSFVTGESEPVEKKPGDKIFAGGRQLGGAIELSLTRKVSQSYLTELWNDEAFTKERESRTSRIADRVGKYFTFAILFIGLATLLFWLPKDVSRAVNAFTAVLIIACPCAVALTIPFIFGNVLRILGRQHFYLKNTAVIEALGNIQATVFDKTGTITERQSGEVSFAGVPLSSTERQLLRLLVHPSTHPISRQIGQFLARQTEEETGTLSLETRNWEEVLGKGIHALIGHHRIKLGSKSFMDEYLHDHCPDDKGVYVQVNHELRGYFKINSPYRDGLAEVTDYFRKKGPLFLLSGDNDREKAILAPLFEPDGKLLFRQNPKDKLLFVKSLQSTEKKVLMLGDGLNDAGALQQSDVGIVVAENTNNFTPACDAILHAGQFSRLPVLLDFASKSIRLVYYAYLFALVYNIIGLSFAVQGLLSPVIAAILMPLSSVSIVLFGMLSSTWLAGRMGISRSLV